MKRLGLVAVGGGCGAVARFGVTAVVAPHWVALLVVNVVGSAALGAVTAWARGRGAAHADWVLPLVGVGFLGGFTTFSSVMLAGVTGAGDPNPTALAHLGLQLGTCLLGAWLGMRWAPGRGDA